MTEQHAQVEAGSGHVIAGPIWTKFERGNAGKCFEELAAWAVQETNLQPFGLEPSDLASLILFPAAITFYSFCTLQAPSLLSIAICMLLMTPNLKERGHGMGIVH